MSVIIDKRYGWQSGEAGEIKFWRIGSERGIAPLLRAWKEDGALSIGDFTSLMRQAEGNFAFIAEGRDRIFCAADRTRSYPLFYAQDGTDFLVSNSARAVKKEKALDELNPLSLLEFSMAGYVTGQETLFRRLCQLQSGECLIWERARQQIEKNRYYLYVPHRAREEKEKQLLEELEEVNNRVFRRIADRAGSREIWVPLSGGLDSRLVLCKLHELGCKHLRAFSYGPPGNYEAKAAKQVAETVGVPWIFVPTRHRSFRAFFHSSLRKEYWSFSDGLCSVPNMQDLDPLLDLMKGRKLPSDAVLVNGQSGDFITGGHIPKSLMDGPPSTSELADAVIGKHFSLWLDLKTQDNLSTIEGRILSLLQCLGEQKMDRERMIALYELWEWQERQCKYVVNGQRVYDFLGLSWELPLWDDAYLRFWQDIPVRMKFGQDLYRRYLRAYNYKSLFKDFSPTIWHWPGITLSIVAVAQVVEWLLGRAWKEKLYKHAGYFGHYGPLYAGYGFRDFLRKIAGARNAISFYVDTWLKENGLPCHSPV